jgi:hypothetical protein
LLLVVEQVVVDMVVVEVLEVWYLHLVVVYLFLQVLSQLLLEVVVVDNLNPQVKEPKEQIQQDFLLQV